MRSGEVSPHSAPLRIGNASGFYGDRLSAMREMLTGGELDVLTGDYLAELTMLVLGRDRLRDTSLGYARTYLRQLEECLGIALERGVKLVSNAGGLAPARLAARTMELAAGLGLSVRVAHVEGDDLLGRGGWGEQVVSANVYLGGEGIAECLRAGADVIVTGRVTDAALVSGSAAAHFGWGRKDHDRLAGAVVTGHILECGTQATGGNYSFFAEELRRRGLRSMLRPGFPLAELHEDGSAVITKHDGTGGLVDVGTVTAQLLYETSGARYANPDVTARLDSVRLEQQGPDRVRVAPVRGEAPPPTLKVGLSRLGGFFNEVTFVLTGLDIEDKAALVRAQMREALAGEPPADMRWELVRTDHADSPVQETASALLRLVVRDARQEAVGRPVTAAAMELALAGYPGFHVTAPPGKASPYGVFQAVPLGQDEVEQVAVLPDGERLVVAPPEETLQFAEVLEPELPAPPPEGEPTRRVPLGLVAGARSGDKGGDANVGLWVRQAEAFPWLVHTLTVDRLRELLPETAPLTVTRHVLPGLLAVNFVIEGLLGEGVASRARFDPQAKGLGEWLRGRHLDVPVRLLPVDVGTARSAP